MGKKYLILRLMAMVFLFDFFGCNYVIAQKGFDNYITISNGEFWNGDTVFKPLCINYVVDYACNVKVSTNKKYYIAPCFNYSDTGSGHLQTEINDILYDWHLCYGTDGNTEMINAQAKLNRDLDSIDSLGFNVVRLRPAIYWKNNVLHIPTGSYAKYFELTDDLIAKCAEHGLRVILVLEADTFGYSYFNQYCVYLDSVTRHYSTNKAVMAYVVFAEPGYKWRTINNNDKLLISNWSRKWYYLIKKNAPNQLVTYALDGIGNVLFWDPSALTYDFLTMHFYYGASDPDISKMAIHSYFRWMNDNVEDVWVLGETGFSGTTDNCQEDPRVGTDTAQYQYAEYTMLKALSCGCKGYSWWQYQDVKWNDCFQDYLGIFTHYPHERAKPVASLFPSYPPHPQYMACERPNCYYNIPNYPHENIYGVVLDQNANPIRDAYVVAWSTSCHTSYSTFTDNQGRYTISTPEDTILSLVWVSQKGYTSKTIDHTGTAIDTYHLTRINYNGWQKNWTNSNYPVTGDNFVIHNSDVVVVGNFYGDEAHEMLLVNRSTGTASMYRFSINHWSRIWHGTIYGWQISSTDKFYAGDFNGDGYDEVLCVQNVQNGWANIYQFVYNLHQPNNPWQYVWTNSGNGKIGNWNYDPGDIILPGRFNDTTYCSLLCIRNVFRPKGLCQRLSSGSWETLWSPVIGIGPMDTTLTSPLGFDQYYVGDFNGDKLDELLCTDVSNGSTDMMKLIRYDNGWNTLWTNNGQSDGVAIYPYRANLLLGNFDKDRADEILGVSSWATKFDFNTNNQWDWSWSTYQSAKLSDWVVNPNHQLFFMKVMTDVPDYLFIGRWIQNNYFRFDGYSFDP